VPERSRTILRWPLFSWPGRHRRPHGEACLSAIFIAPAAGAPMVALNAVEAITGLGLQGDRYALKRGYWKVTEACQVTLISEHDLQHAVRRLGRNGPADGISGGSHRRNLVVSGLTTAALQGKDFRIGEALFRYRRPRPPCGYLDQVAYPGLAKALGRNSGVCIEVIEGGQIRVGDQLRVE